MVVRMSQKGRRKSTQTIGAGGMRLQRSMNRSVIIIIVNYTGR